ncbi:MAG: hypothetical protein KKA05_05145 [Alphaproteobacteria bacterium]|nr:hypothetical protein [Alphaproteobacteria bacterium]
MTPLKSIGEMKHDALRDLFTACVEKLIVGDLEGREQLIAEAKQKGLSDSEIDWVTEELVWKPQDYKKVFGELSKPLQAKLKEFDSVQIMPFFKGFYPDPKLH